MFWPGHTEALPCFGPEVTYVLIIIHSLLARTNHMAKPTAIDLRSTVSHAAQRAGEMFTYLLNMTEYFAPCLQYLSVPH